jgi:GT2 family glycosyltransferase
VDPTIGVAQSKLRSLRNRNIIDCVGVSIDSYGMPYIIGHDEEDKGQYDYIHEIFCAAGNAITIKKDVLAKVGFFDPDFFIHLEDDDLCWRAWLNGYRVACAKKSIVFHLGSGTLSKQSQEMKIFQLWKNRILLLIKNYNTYNLLRYLPISLLLILIASVLNTLRGNFNGVRCYLNVIKWLISNFKRIWLKRVKVQSNRKVTDDNIKKLMLRKPVFVYTSQISKLKRAH